MKTDTITLAFDSQFIGTMTSPTGTVKIGQQEGGIMPYHLLYGALGSCFYSTFLSIAVKKRLSFSKATVSISGTKRETVPTTLDHVVIDLIIYDASDEAQFRKSAKLGAEYCSIHQTISQVATMDLNVSFQTSK